VPPLRLKPGSVHVWIVDLESSPATAEVLSPSELARAARFRFARDRRRFIASHAALREILAAYTGILPASLEFIALPHGKPALVSGDLRFNLSHSADLALVALASGAEVGVDIERIRAQLELEAIARRFFSPSETDALLAYPEPERESAFFRCWTRKEAYVKALGGGLTISLASFAVSLDPNRAALLSGVEAPWTLHSLDVHPAYCAALAVAGNPAQISLRPWPANR
jgi:4'-phosphopantetheinyl transferase